MLSFYVSLWGQWAVSGLWVGLCAGLCVGMWHCRTIHVAVCLWLCDNVWLPSSVCSCENVFVTVCACTGAHAIVCACESVAGRVCAGTWKFTEWQETRIEVSEEWECSYTLGRAHICFAHCRFWNSCFRKFFKLYCNRRQKKVPT